MWLLAEAFRYLFNLNKINFKIILEVGVFVIPILCGTNNEKCTPFGGFDIVVFIHAGYWILKYMFDRFYHYKHMWHRRQGYLEFYRVTRWLRTIPFLIISAGNSLLIVLIKILNKYCPAQTKCTSANLTEINFLQIFVSIETALLIPILVYYLGKIWVLEFICIIYYF